MFLHVNCAMGRGGRMEKDRDREEVPSKQRTRRRLTFFWVVGGVVIVVEDCVSGFLNRWLTVDYMIWGESDKVTQAASLQKFPIRHSTRN
jgi:hypothetical protein